MTTASPPLPTPTVLDCNDSPLSTTASIVSILTFALGLIASYVALQAATRGAPSEIARLVDDLRSAQSEINRVAEYIFDDAHHAPPEPPTTSASGTNTRFLGAGGKPQYAVTTDSISSGSLDGTARGEGIGTGATRVADVALDSLYEETQALLASCIRLFYETDSLLKLSVSDSSRWDPEGLRRRVVFVMNRHEVAEKMQRLAEQKRSLGSVQMSLFMRKSVVQDRLLRQMSGRLENLERRAREGEDSGDFDVSNGT